MTKTRQERWAPRSMLTGLGLTIAATVLPYVDRATTHLLADHIRAGYPAYTQARINSAVTTCLVLWSVIGALGVIAWLWTAWAVAAGKRWARPAVTVLFVLGAGIALTVMLTRDTSGEVGLPPELGWAWMAPCLTALLAVLLLGRRPRVAGPGRGRPSAFDADSIEGDSTSRTRTARVHHHDKPRRKHQ
ncbi:hypothetical protein [Streptomyces sp. H39-S7]|uniref:hypothetical protein n=1 Tax=Streptomyces sp. H39-S7 TaxID=3004357 RepID=UPI0022AFC10D|nr:hypothetical protein [Streptomyces sp. H39-S7]MCZ4124749.1 hypothetical protein [Streptomyces sp. H39-S7]